MNTQPLTTYKKLSTEFYDLEQHPYDDVAQIFYRNYAEQANGHILEPMCGTGRFLIPLLQAGFDIEGFDASPHMLQALTQKYEALTGKQAPVTQQFVQDFKSEKQYTLIFVPYGSWGLMTNIEDSKKGLEIMYQHLLPGGKLILEIETVASVPQPSGVWRHAGQPRPDGSQLTLNILTSYDESTQLFKSDCHYNVIKETAIIETETEDFQMYLYRFDEMDELLKNTGFTDIKKYQDHDKNPAIDQQAHLLIYECTK